MGAGAPGGAKQKRQGRHCRRPCGRWVKGCSTHRLVTICGANVCSAGLSQSSLPFTMPGSVLIFAPVCALITVIVYL